MIDLKAIRKPSNNTSIFRLGDVTYAKNLAAMYLARDAVVRMVSLPPHTTHRLQPLDVAFFGPLGTYYDEAMYNTTSRTTGTKRRKSS